MHLKAVHKFDDPWVISLRHHVPLSLHVCDLILENHVFLQHALHRVHLDESDVIQKGTGHGHQLLLLWFS